MSRGNLPTFNTADSWSKVLQSEVERRLKAESKLSDSKGYVKCENNLKELNEFTSKWSEAAKNAVRNGEIDLIVSYIDEVNRRVENAWSSWPSSHRLNDEEIEHELSVAKYQGAALYLTEKTYQKEQNFEEEAARSLYTSNIERIKNETNIANLEKDVFNLVQKNMGIESNRVQVDAVENSDLAKFHSISSNQNVCTNFKTGEDLNPPKQISNQSGIEGGNFLPVFEPNCHDVLCGRGYKIIFKEGNTYFRNLVSALRHEYVATSREDKKYFAESVHRHIRSLDPPGRFLDRKSDKEPFFDIGLENSIKKTSQALREGQPEIQKKIERREINVRVVKKSEVAELIKERSKEVYANTFSHYNGAASARHGELSFPIAEDLGTRNATMRVDAESANNSHQDKEKLKENGKYFDSNGNFPFPLADCQNSIGKTFGGTPERRTSTGSISVELASSVGSCNETKQKRHSYSMSITRMSIVSTLSGISDIDFGCSGDEEEKKCSRNDKEEKRASSDEK